MSAAVNWAPQSHDPARSGDPRSLSISSRTVLSVSIISLNLLKSLMRLVSLATLTAFACKISPNEDWRCSKVFSSSLCGQLDRKEEKMSVKAGSENGCLRKAVTFPLWMTETPKVRLWIGMSSNLFRKYRTLLSSGSNGNSLFGEPNFWSTY